MEFADKLKTTARITLSQRLLARESEDDRLQAAIELLEDIFWESTSDEVEDMLDGCLHILDLVKKRIPENV